MSILSSMIQFRAQEDEREQRDVQAIGSSINNFLTIKRQSALDEIQRKNAESQIESRKFQEKFNVLRGLGDTLDVAEQSGNIQLRNQAKAQIDSLISGDNPLPQGNTLDSFIPNESEDKDVVLKPTSTQVVKQDLIPTQFNKFGEPIKFKSKKSLDDEVTAKKIAETNFKRQVFSQDLETFQAIDNQLKRGTGFIDRIVKGGQSKLAGLDQSSAEGFAVSTHDAARKRLRVQLVRAAGDVGNINIVEQKAAEQMIPSIFDSEGTAELKNAFMQEIGKAIGDNDSNAVKDVLKRFMDTEEFDGPKGDEAEKILNDQDEKLRSFGLDPAKFEIIGVE